MRGERTEVFRKSATFFAFSSLVETTWSSWVPSFTVRVGSSGFGASAEGGGVARGAGSVFFGDACGAGAWTTGAGAGAGATITESGFFVSWAAAGSGVVVRPAR